MGRHTALAGMRPADMVLLVGTVRPADMALLVGTVLLADMAPHIAAVAPVSRNSGSVVLRVGRCTDFRRGQRPGALLPDS